MHETNELDRPADSELLSFWVNGQEYTIDVMFVRELRGWSKSTPLPHAPDFVHGVINLRGNILTVLDLACRLGLRPINATERNVIIVAEIQGKIVGLLVDRVSDIFSIPTNSQQALPDIGSGSGQRFVTAILTIEDRLIRVLDLKAIVNVDAANAA
ncbi:chemotaxis protein CheW [Pseudohalocynthiibacter aestuariivivens]|jgi:purine-binding chemotaxis protein CheW|uniref:Chemotaxis protein CheW n=1 Tax=Pseudohalocynthiibacter aestuariivivens TaxID=1591409 RepID=A0ABV5JGH5_9RHOB|nr:MULTISPECIES: chemotaxis protein CheW [Pseudohalocynthiibacter]MBS9716097.1 purine-binding chemotaxis protein CheW [Pseudohalocynthiibacter aestuariivivens]MCK0101096.1 chemotaxis protein CheW [Pseudohalocynthiibacter sp. F2068]